MGCPGWQHHRLRFNHLSAPLGCEHLQGRGRAFSPWCPEYTRTHSVAGRVRGEAGDGLLGLMYCSQPQATTLGPEEDWPKQGHGPPNPF